MPAATASIYMVASSCDGAPRVTGVHSARGTLRPSFTRFVACVCVMAAKSSSAVALPAIASDRPLAAAMLEWEKSAKPLLQPEQRALIDGQTPLCLLQYEPASLPAALVVNTADGTTAQHVQARELDRLRTTDKNKMLKQQRATHESEIKLAIFSSIENCLKAAPLLLEDLKKQQRGCLQAVSYTHLTLPTICSV